MYVLHINVITLIRYVLNKYHLCKALFVGTIEVVEHKLQSFNRVYVNTPPPPKKKLVFGYNWRPLQTVSVHSETSLHDLILRRTT